MADTHVGEYLPRLPPGVIEALRGVDLILHVGDLTVPGVLPALRRVAPVVAVLGNHDEAAGLRLPRAVVAHVGGVRIGVVHGTRPRPVEVASALLTIVTGRPWRLGLTRRLRRRFGDVDCVVFGHLHQPIGQRVGGTLMFSPGAVMVPEADPAHAPVGLRPLMYRLYRRALPPEARRPSVGILEIAEGRLVAAHVVAVPGALRPAPVADVDWGFSRTAV